MLQGGVDGLEQVAAVNCIRRRLIGIAVEPDRRHQATNRRVCRGDRLGSRRCVRGQPAAYLREREIGQRAVSEVQAVPGQHPPVAFQCDAGQLGQDAALADPGISRKQHGTATEAPTVSGGIAVSAVCCVRRDTEQLDEFVQFRRAAYQRTRGGGIQRHEVHHDLPRRQSHLICGRQSHVAGEMVACPPPRDAEDGPWLPRRRQIGGRTARPRGCWVIRSRR